MVKRVAALFLTVMLLCVMTACTFLAETKLPTAENPTHEHTAETMHRPVPEPDLEPITESDLMATPEPSRESTPEPAPQPLTNRPVKLPILMYHHIVKDGEPCNQMTVTVSRFREDMEWLIEHGYQFVLPRDLISQQPLPEKAVMVSFDDGYQSNYELAFPVMKELNVKIILALIVSKADWYVAGQGLSWDMCREMQDSGLVEFGSHTYQLHNLDERAGGIDPDGPNGIQRLPDESREGFEKRVIEDIRLSIDTMKRELGVEPIYFAYPYGQTEEWAEDFINENFYVTTITTPDCADLSEDFYALERYTISMEDKPSSVLP